MTNLSTLKDCIRSVISAEQDKHLVVADFSNIESRVLPWLAGEQWKLDAFIDQDEGTGTDVYNVMFFKLFGTPIQNQTGFDRLIGKVAELACGYQGWVGAFHSMAKGYNIDITDEEAIDVVKAWREAHPNIVQFWADVEDAAFHAIENEGSESFVSFLRFQVIEQEGNKYLTIELPSGRSLFYLKPEVIFNEQRRSNQVSYMGIDTYTRKWGRLSTYGGKLVENIVQAVARDIMCEAMLNLDKMGFTIVLTVHDEIVCEESIGSEFDLGLMLDAMCYVPKWATGLPLNAEGYEAKHYRKG